MIRRMVFVVATLLAARAGATECEASLKVAGELAQLDKAYPKAPDRLAQLKQRIAADPTNLYWRQAADLVIDDDLQDYTGALSGERALAAAHPETQLYNFLVANLVRFDQPADAIAQLQSILAKDPMFVRSHFVLSQIYAQQKDAPRAAGELGLFMAACPEAYDGYESMLRHADPALLARGAANLRELLATQTDPVALQQYATLWPLEFKITPLAKHATVRARVAADLAHLRQLLPAPDDEMLGVLASGYKSTSDAEGTKWVDAQKSSRPPTPHDLFREYMQWSAAHPAPGKSGTAADRAAFDQAQGAVGAEWLKRWPHADLAWSMRVASLTPSTPPADVRALVAQMLAACEDCKSTAAEIYVAHSIELDKALAFLAEERAHIDAILLNQSKQPARHKMLSDFSKGSMGFLRAQAYAAKHDATKLRATVVELKQVVADDEKNTDPTAKELVPYDRGFYWRARALQAAEDKQFADAVAFLLQARDAQPGSDDDSPKAPTVLAKAYWKQAGGTDEGWTLVTAKGQTKATDTQSDWTTKSQPLAPLALHDLKDRVWTGKDIHGKTLFAVAWATWCEPCKAELPLVQKLYEQTRNRKDILVVSMNVDADTGQVVPFIAENKYTFPVLFAADYMKDFTSGGIPFSMIVDHRGTVRSTRLGFDSNATWVADTLKSVEAIK